MLEGPVEANRKAVADCGVTDVETGELTGGGKYILWGVIWLGFGDVVVDRVGVDEGDCEAIRGKLDGQVNEGDDMTLERPWYQNSMRFKIGVVIHHG